MDSVAQAPPPVENGNGGRKKYMFIILALLAVVGGIVGAKWLMHRLAYTETDDAQVDADLIPVSFKVPGRIAKLYVSEGDKVSAGAIISELDDTDFRLALSLAEARLEADRKELEKAGAALDLTRAQTSIGVLQSEAGLNQVRGGVSISSTQQDVNLTKLGKDVERARLDLDLADQRIDEASAVSAQARLDLQRATNLYASGVVPKDQLDRARTNTETANARLAQARQGKAAAIKQLEITKNNARTTGIDRARTGMAVDDRRKAGLSLKLSVAQQEQQVRMAALNVESLSARVKASEKAVEQAREALKETRIISPVNGIAAKKISLQGAIVAAGTPVFFILDSESIRVTANIEETNLENIHAGSRAVMTVDALPGRKFKGVVKTIGAASNSKFSLIPAGNTSGQYIKTTQRVPIKIFLDGDTSMLRPGTNVEISIKNKQ